MLKSWIYILPGLIFISGVNSDQVTLLTTEGVTTNLNWRVENINELPGFNGWDDLSILYKDEIVRGYQVCQINIDQNVKEKPQTWLLLPGVEINAAPRIFIEMNFTMRECSDLEKTCRETFSVYYRLTEGNLQSESDYKFEPLDYKKIDTVAAEVRFSTASWNSLINSETVSISLKNSTKNTALHIAIMDAGACISLMGVRIYHKVCRRTTAGFAYFRETKTGISDTSLVPVTGRCVSNSIYPEPGLPLPDIVLPSATLEPVSDDLIGPLYHCTSSGDWQVQTGSCQCKPGYQPDLSKTKCEPCTSGMHKPLIGNHNCTICPVHSNTAKQGEMTCQCDSGYFTVELDEEKVEDEPSLLLPSITLSAKECDLCSKLPFSPNNLKIHQRDPNNPGSIEVSWKAPTNDGGCYNVQYCVLCQFNSMQQNNSAEALDCDHLNFHSSQCYINNLKVTTTGLRGHTSYNFTVVSFTLATKQKFPNLIENFYENQKSKRANTSNRIVHIDTQKLHSLLDSSSSSIVYKTGDTLPSSVQNPMITMENQTAVALKWNEPKYPNGVILFYKVKYALVNEIKDSSEKPSNVPAQFVSHKYTWEYIIVNETYVLLTDLYPGSIYEIIITVHNSAGSDNGSNPLLAYTVSFDDSANNQPTNTGNFPYLIATIVIAALVFIICLILILQWKCRSNNRKHENKNGFTEQQTEFRPYNSHHEAMDQRTYIDPYSIDAISPHRFLCETSVESISCGQVIGCGEFGEVYKGTLATIDLKTGQETTIDVAVKQLRDQCEPQEQINFLREAMSLEKFRHPNIVHLEAVVTQSRPFFIVTELMDHGSLHGFLTSIKEKTMSKSNGHDWSLPISHRKIAEMLKGVASGMEYLSGRGFVHRDLAARNVLINSDLVCKVADFGLMREVENNDSESGSNGSGTYTTRGGKIAIKWTAPEAVAFRTFTQFSDVWSFGILMWEASSFGESPYWDMTNHEVIKVVNDGMRLPAPEKCPSVFHQLMLECWQRDHHKRPTFTKILTRFNEMLSDLESLEVPASPASCGMQEMFFGENEDVTIVDVNDPPTETNNDDDDAAQISDNEDQEAEPLLTTVMVDRHNVQYGPANQEPRNNFKSTNEDEEGTGSEVSSCTSTICASEITVCAANGVAVYVPLVRSDSDEIRPSTPSGYYPIQA
ncbi:ephrin type-A receptor 3-like isoform X1 [Styela clava]